MDDERLDELRRRLAYLERQEQKMTTDNAKNVFREQIKKTRGMIEFLEEYAKEQKQ